MKKINLKNKNELTIVVLLSVFAVLLAACIVALVFLIKMVNKPTETPKLDPPEILTGEGIKNNYATAYPEVSDELIQSISVKNKHGEYKFVRNDGVKDFVLYYTDTNGKWQVFYPQICEEDAAFEYSDIYSIEMNDSFQAITKLAYLCMAIEAPYFSERINLSTDPTVKAGEEKVYGLDEESRHTITFGYVEKDADGKVITDGEGEPIIREHFIEIGDAIINGEGHYYRVDGRDYIYSARNNYFSYGLADYASFIKATLVSEGLTDDNGFGPYLTPNYYQWMNEKFDGAKEGDTESAPTLVPEKSTVVVYSDKIYPSADLDGRYITDGYSLIELDLEAMIGKENYKPLMNILVGKAVGERDGDYSQNKLIASLLSRSKTVDFEKADSLVYEYTVTEIVAVLTDEGDVEEVGEPVGSTDKIKVKYTYKINGELQDEGRSHYGVIDLSEAAYAAVRDEFDALTVGELASPVSFELSYAKESARQKKVTYVITKILSIFDQKGKEQKKVDAESIVTLICHYEVDGVAEADETVVLNLKGEDESNDAIRDAILGYGVGEFAEPKVVREDTVYYEELYDFVTYTIARIDFFITKELVVAFRFKNATERDPYYGESLYENLMTGKYSLYGLNATSCEGVVKVLGGISNDGAAGTAQGLFGSETVAIGITPEIKEKYGLYAYEIFYELPRQIEPYKNEDGSDNEETDDYYWYDTLSFTLYISEVDPISGTRYVGSDMYDVVTKIKAEELAFLDYDFETFWARRNLVLMDINHIDSMKVEFFMEDLKGSYLFDLTHKEAYVKGNKKTYTKPDEVGWSTFNEISVNVHTEGECTENKLTQHIEREGYTSGMLSLTELYDYEYLTKYQGTEGFTEKQLAYNKMLKDADFDFIGTAYFKEALRTLYLVGYAGTMTDEEQAEAISEDKLVMRMSFKLLNVNNASTFKYVYSFYRLDDRRVLVSIHQEDDEGNIKISPVSDLYVSTFALKKMVGNIVGVLNAELIEPEIGYPEDRKSGVK